MMKFKSCGALVLASLITSPVGAVELAAYQAGYSVHLSSVRDTSSILAVTGKIAYGVEKLCNGWLFQQSGTMNMHLPDGNVLPQVMNFSSIETGPKYQFSVSTEGIGKEVILGRAEMGAEGELGQATFSRPEKKSFSLPADTLFPAAHTRLMIEAAEAGKHQLQSHIFEGTDVDEAKLLVVFVSPMSDQGKAIIQKLGGKLKNRAGWNFRLAYFDPKSQTGEPLYEVGVDQLDNGVALRWVLDYGTHAVEMKMVKVEILDNPDCTPK
ncbi:MAG: hypothetical protein COB59_00685 [Rhodospirillaceae bacterium]|nr:MAG: hypothetical protein COB59_00685 [Rhodospirillaceae bacterium]